MPATNSEVSAVGIFPSLDGVPGGVQASGREAREALQQRFGAQHVRQLSYGNSTSKLATVLAAMSLRGRRDIVLVWHIGLLKLLPFVDPSCSTGVAFIHGVEAWKPLDRITAVILARTASILTNSDHTWRRFLQFNPHFANHTHITVPLGIGSARAEPTLPTAESPMAVMVGRLDASEAYKGHREVIEAWSEVRNEVPGATLQIVGEGDLIGELRQVVTSNGLEEQVRFVGKLTNEQRDRILAQARCLVLPSRGEGFGLVYLEAMRLGRPCLVSTLDAGQEVVNPPEAGLAVDPSSRHDVAAAICRLLTAGPRWDEWSARARARYEERFTSELFRGRLVRAVDRVMETRAARSLVANV